MRRPGNIARVIDRQKEFQRLYVHVFRPGMFFAIIRLNWNGSGVQKPGAGAKTLGRATLQDFK